MSCEKCKCGNKGEQCRCAQRQHACLCPCSFGLAVGVTKGLLMIIAAWVAMGYGYGVDMVEHYAKFYHGYGATWAGGLIGGLWGLLGGFIFGFVAISLYNFFVCCGQKCRWASCKTECCECCPNEKKKLHGTEKS